MKKEYHRRENIAKALAWDIHIEKIPLQCVEKQMKKSIEFPGKCYQRDLHIWCILQGRRMLLNYTKNKEQSAPTKNCA